MSARLTIVLGPGGVGKTTLSASLALAAAQRGEKTVGVTVDPAKRLAQALGSETLPHQPGAVAEQPGFYAATLDRAQAWDEMIARCAARRAMKPSSVERLLANRFYKHLRDELGGSAEIITTDYVAHLLEEGGFDRIVLDTPPAHDALGFLDAPKRFADFMDSRILDLLLGKGSFRLSRTLVLKVLSRLTGREMLDELIDFLSLSRDVLEFMGDRGRQVMALQRRELTQYVLVTAPDREGEVAAKRLVGSLATRRLDLSAAFANRMIKEPPSERWTSEPSKAWRDFAARRAEVRSAQAQRDQHQLGHLAEHLSGVAVYPIACLDKEPQSLSDLSSLAAQVPEEFWSE